VRLLAERVVGGEVAGVELSADMVRIATRRNRASVRPLVVVVPQILVEDPLKLASTPDQQPIQALGADRTHPALRVRICLGRSDWGYQHLATL